MQHVILVLHINYNITAYGSLFGTPVILFEINLFFNFHLSDNRNKA